MHAVPIIILFTNFRRSLVYYLAINKVCIIIGKRYILLHNFDKNDTFHFLNK